MTLLLVVLLAEDVMEVEALVDRVEVSLQLIVYLTILVGLGLSRSRSQTAPVRSMTILTSVPEPTSDVSKML